MHRQPIFHLRSALIGRSQLSLQARQLTPQAIRDSLVSCRGSTPFGTSLAPHSGYRQLSIIGSSGHRQLYTSATVTSSQSTNYYELSSSSVLGHFSDHHHFSPQAGICSFLGYSLVLSSGNHLGHSSICWPSWGNHLGHRHSPPLAIA